MPIKIPREIEVGDTFLCGQGIATVASVFYDSRHDHANCMVTLSTDSAVTIAITARRPMQVWSV